MLKSVHANDQPRGSNESGHSSADWSDRNLSVLARRDSNLAKRIALASRRRYAPAEEPEDDRLHRISQDRLANPDLLTAPIVIDGIQSGCLPLALHAATKDFSPTLYLVESDPSTLAAAFEQRDWTTALADPRLVLCVGPKAYDQLAEEIQQRPNEPQPGFVISASHQTPIARAKELLDERATAWYARETTAQTTSLKPTAPAAHNAAIAADTSAPMVRTSPAIHIPVPTRAPSKAPAWPRSTYLINHRYGFIYCPIPKIASSSLKQWFMLTVGLTPDSPAWTDRAHVWVASRSIKSDADLERGYFTFAFVRNPWSRLVSGYTQKFLHRAHHPDSPSRPVVESVCKAKSRPIDYDAAITFREFVEFVAAAPEPAALDYHWRPQSLYLDGVKIDFIGKLESIQRDFESLCNRLDIRERFLFSTLRQEYDEAAGEPVADRPAVELRMSKQLPNYRRFYTPDLIERVASTYRCDIDAFGYTFSD